MRVNLALEKAVVRWREGSSQNHSAVEEAVTRGGFMASSMPSPQHIRQKRIDAVRQQGWKAGVALLLAIPTLIVSMFVSDLGSSNGMNSNWLIAFLLTYLSTSTWVSNSISVHGKQSEVEEQTWTFLFIWEQRQRFFGQHW